MSFNSKNIITSYGIINIKLPIEFSEDKYVKDNYSTNNKLYTEITSMKYSCTKCIMFKDVYLHNKDLHRISNTKLQVNEDNLSKWSYYKNKILFMMVSRRFSLGFIEFIRGRYNLTDYSSIISLFRQMRHNEIELIENSSYEDLLYMFLNRNNEDIKTVLSNIYESKYGSEYCDAKVKFNILSSQEKCNELDIMWNLYFYTQQIKPLWRTSEWGFPKGRREKSENTLRCACREFEEETGINNYFILNNIEPLSEYLIGTNGIQYKHVYFLSIDCDNVEQNTNNYDSFEIDEIKWFTYDEAMSNIRPYHVEKKKILTQVYSFILELLINKL